MQLNQNKLKRQEEGVQKWADVKGKGTLQYCTGMGKTFTALLIISRMLERDSRRKTVIIVPTIQLKEQWEAEVAYWKIKNTTVYVVNTVSLNRMKLDCDLLVLDEIHRYGGHLDSAADTAFVKVFEYVKYKFILGLSATVKRMDDLHEILLEHAPVVDTITLEDAKKNGWVSEYVEYNLGITLTAKDMREYDSITKQFNKLFSWFGYDLDVATGCMSTKDRWVKGKLVQGANEYAKSLNRDPKEIIAKAVKLHKLMRERKEFLYNAQAKLEATEKLIRKIPVKTITFSESTKFATALADKLGDIAVEYHSYLKTQSRSVKGKTVKYGAGRLKKEALIKITDNRYKTRVISTAKALDVGFDCDDIELGIITSYTSNPTQNIQRKGRVVRLLKQGKVKNAIIVNLYIKGSQEEKWLRRAQKGFKGIKWIDTMEEIEHG